MQAQPDKLNSIPSIRNTPGVSVHDGFPNPATDARLQSLDLNQLLIRHTASTFFMTIEGNEWQDAGIFAGDLVIIDKALSPRITDIVIWWRDGTFAISQYHGLQDGTTVWGVVTAVVHRFRRPS